MVRGIGYVGIGKMGAGMARNILSKKEKTDTLYVWNRTASKAEALVRDGAVLCKTPADLAKQCDIIFMCLAGPNECKNILCGENGLLEGAKAKQVIFDLSTIDIQTSRQLNGIAKEKGVTYIDMPVSGGTSGAASGTLSLMCGATEEEMKDFLPYCMLIAEKITYLKSRGLGAAAKLIHNFVSLSTTLLNAYSLVMADAVGLSAEDMIEILMKGAGYSRSLELQKERILTGNEEGGHSVTLAVKDLELCDKMNRLLGVPGFFLDEAIQWYKFTARKGLGEHDCSAATRLLREQMTPVGEVEVYEV